MNAPPDERGTTVSDTTHVEPSVTPNEPTPSERLLSPEPSQEKIRAEMERLSGP